MELVPLYSLLFATQLALQLQLLIILQQFFVQSLMQKLRIKCLSNRL